MRLKRAGQLQGFRSIAVCADLGMSLAQRKRTPRGRRSGGGRTRRDAAQHLPRGKREAAEGAAAVGEGAETGMWSRGMEGGRSIHLRGSAISRRLRLGASHRNLKRLLQLAAVAMALLPQRGGGGA